MELILKPMPVEAPNPRIEDYLGGILNLIDNKQAVHFSDKKTKSMRAVDYHVDYELGLLFILLHYADINLSDPAFEHLEKGVVRIEEKREGEGIAVSTHMAIDLKSRDPSFGAYRVLLEDVTGIGRTKLEPFLTYMMRLLPRMEFSLDDGKVRKFRSVAELHGFQSVTLKEDLSSGVLSGIELVQVGVAGSEYDEEGLLKEERRAIKLDVEKKLPTEGAIELINRVTGKARNNGFSNMRVTWRRDEGKQKSRAFGTHREDVSDVLTLGTSHMRYDALREQCEQEIRADVVENLKEVLLSQRKQ
ncbi:hypothetical protein [Oceanicaulis sp. HTCC2633]|uniref:hypothetical protein n=1 Tax=Oceanicaulis sp. HTCC2633 TaxID=314254 RepID=UPI00058ABF92|nr:hypothetical protein [Oceanicaulis sp. HTCC2633]